MKNDLLKAVDYNYTMGFQSPVSERTPGTVEELQKLRTYKKNARENARRLQSAHREQKRIAELYKLQRDFYQGRRTGDTDMGFTTGFFAGLVFGVVTAWIFLQI